jgi:hypothetical protein
MVCCNARFVVERARVVTEQKASVTLGETGDREKVFMKLGHEKNFLENTDNLISCNFRGNFAGPSVSQAFSVQPNADRDKR